MKGNRTQKPNSYHSRVENETAKDEATVQYSPERMKAADKNAIEISVQKNAFQLLRNCYTEEHMFLDVLTKFHGQLALTRTLEMLCQLNDTDICLAHCLAFERMLVAFGRKSVTFMLLHFRYFA
jgi:hypothetical protein